MRIGMRSDAEMTRERNRVRVTLTLGAGRRPAPKPDSLALADGAEAGLGSKVIHPKRGVRRVNHGEISRTTRGKTTRRILEAERTSRDDRGALQYLGRCHALKRAGEKQREVEIVARGRPRIEIGRHPDRDAGIDQSAGSKGWLSEIYGCERETHGHHTGPRHRRDPRVRDVFEVVRRGRTNFGREEGSPAVGQLIRVQLGSEPDGFARQEDPPRFGDAERRLLYKHIAELR